MLLNMIGLPTSPKRGTPLYNGQLTQLTVVVNKSEPFKILVLRLSSSECSIHGSCSDIPPAPGCFLGGIPGTLEAVFFFCPSITTYRYSSSLEQHIYCLEVSWVKSLDMAELSPPLRV